jgi:hypothetical protein
MHAPAVNPRSRRPTAYPTRGVAFTAAAVVGSGLIAAFVLVTWTDFTAPKQSGVPRPAVETHRPIEARPVHRVRAIREVDGSARLDVLRAEIAAGANGLEVLKELGETEPAKAIDSALLLGRNGDERDQWVTALTRAWALREPQAAWDWLGQQTVRMDQLANGSLIGVVLDAMAARAPQRVVENVDALLRQGDVPGIIPPLVACQLGLIALVAHGDIEDARAAVEDWARHPRALEIGASAYDTVATAIGQDSWPEASAWLATLPASPSRTAAFAVLASKWGDRDPAAALGWAESLSPENGQFAAVQTVFSDWAERDGSHAAEWLSGYVDRAKSDAEIDQLIGILITFTADLKRDPQQALAWVNMMRDDQQRAALVERVAMRWGRTDLPGATSFVETSDAFTATEKRTLEKRLIDQATDPEPIDD